MATNDNSYIYDPESATEMARLINLARLATITLGGPLNGLPALPQKACVLDLGCGPGGWVLNLAFDYPTFEVYGVDLSRSMIDYANARAHAQELNNASFGVMNITKPLDFDDASFDLVNARFLIGALKRDNWASLISECTRILRPGGILRLTESDDMGTYTSQAAERLSSLAIRASWHLGYGFSPDGRSFAMSAMLLKLLRTAGYGSIQLLPFVIDHSAHTDSWADFRYNNEIIYQQISPIIISLGLATPEELEQLIQQVRLETYSDDFACLAHVTSIWGDKGGSPPKH